MNATLSRVSITGAVFLFLLLSGYGVTRSGKPYPVLLFTVHKFIALGLIIYLAVTINKMREVAPLTLPAILSIGIAALIFVVLLVTGGLLSVAKPMPGAVTIAHHVLPYLSILSTTAALYFLFRG